MIRTRTVIGGILTDVIELGQGIMLNEHHSTATCLTSSRMKSNNVVTPTSCRRRVCDTTVGAHGPIRELYGRGDAPGSRPSPG